MKSKILLFVLLCADFCFAQTATEVLANYSKEFAKPQYMKYSTKYTLYKGYNSADVLESYTGNFKKNKQNDVYMKAMNNELMANKKMSITVTNLERVIYIENPRPYSAGDFDIKELLPYFKIGSMEAKNGLYKISLISTPASGFPYSKIEIFINKKYQLVEQVFYFSTAYDVQNKTGKSDTVYPKLVVKNTNYNYDPIPESVFKSEGYVKISGNKITPLKQGYKLYDKREQSK